MEKGGGNNLTREEAPPLKSRRELPVVNTTNIASSLLLLTTRSCKDDNWGNADAPPHTLANNHYNAKAAAQHSSFDCETGFTDTAFSTKLDEKEIERIILSSDVETYILSPFDGEADMLL
eukprot:CAMPEP_0119011094 /NCGR_PEP_ID=MMETSP1176-20130426/5452_1 /TAXON_ID=265551 /ORGANISM="Synedropsis recta cf, Strain CCMP1620" /LENGTH=119 /DNA_ID=CAMNT_0006963867 /DNA_START=454 /DNA_END=813 /DNA_ORIENTATION=+